VGFQTDHARNTRYAFGGMHPSDVTFVKTAMDSITDHSTNG
jgi:hypothetical protein